MTLILARRYTLFDYTDPPHLSLSNLLVGFVWEAVLWAGRGATEGMDPSVKTSNSLEVQRLKYRSSFSHDSSD